MDKSGAFCTDSPYGFGNSEVGGVISTQSKAVKTMHIKIQRECILLAAYVTTHVEYTYIYGLHTAVPR